MIVDDFGKRAHAEQHRAISAHRYIQNLDAGLVVDRAPDQLPAVRKFDGRVVLNDGVDSLPSVQLRRITRNVEPRQRFFQALVFDHAPDQPLFRVGLRADDPTAAISRQTVPNRQQSARNQMHRLVVGFRSGFGRFGPLGFLLRFRQVETVVFFAIFRFAHRHIANAVGRNAPNSLDEFSGFRVRDRRGRLESVQLAG